MSRCSVSFFTGALFICGFLLFGCVQQPTKSGACSTSYNTPFGQMNATEIIGGALGAAAGAYGGSKIGHGATSYITGAAGSLVGAWVGKSIASYLTQCSQEKMASATNNAIQTGQTQVWSDPESGTNGRAEIIELAPTSAPMASSDHESDTQKPVKKVKKPKTDQHKEVKTVVASQNNSNSSDKCRTIRQTVTLSDGTEHAENITACQGANGWEVKV